MSYPEMKICVYTLKVRYMYKHYEIIIGLIITLYRVNRGKRPMRGKMPFIPSVSQCYYLALILPVNSGTNEPDVV